MAISMGDLHIHEAEFDQALGPICLNFTNTVSSRPELNNERLTDYSRLVAWALHAEAITADEASKLLEESQRRPQDADQVLEQALELRERIYRLFSAIAAGEEPPAVDLEEFNSTLSSAMSHACLYRDEHGIEWGWNSEETDLERPLWPVASSTAELLTDGALDRLRECAGDSCGWLFLDASRNRSRRWCDMNDCGNRAKAKRHYARTKARRA